MVFFAQLMHRLHQRGCIVRVGELGNPVPQVEHMPTAESITGKYLFHFVAYDFRRRKQDIRIQIALQRNLVRSPSSSYSVLLPLSGT